MTDSPVLCATVATLGSTSTGAIDKFGEITTVSASSLLRGSFSLCRARSPLIAPYSRRLPFSLPAHRRRMGRRLPLASRMPGRGVPRGHQCPCARVAERRRHGAICAGGEVHSCVQSTVLSRCRADPRRFPSDALPAQHLEQLAQVWLGHVRRQLPVVRPLKRYDRVAPATGSAGLVRALTLTRAQDPRPRTAHLGAGRHASLPPHRAGFSGSRHRVRRLLLFRSPPHPG